MDALRPVDQTQISRPVQQVQPQQQAAPARQPDPRDRSTVSDDARGGDDRGGVSHLTQGLAHAYGGTEKSDNTDGLTTALGVASRLPGLPKNPTMPIFPAEYNPTSPTAPAELLKRVADPVRQKLGSALDTNKDRDTGMAHTLRLYGEMNHGDEKSMGREDAMKYLQGRYPGISEKDLNAFLDRLADQTNNLPFFRNERSQIFADDLVRFLKDRQY